MRVTLGLGWGPVAYGLRAQRPFDPEEQAPGQGRGIQGIQGRDTQGKRMRWDRVYVRIYSESMGACTWVH